MVTNKTKVVPRACVVISLYIYACAMSAEMGVWKGGRGVGRDHVRKYFADSARQNVHKSAFIKDRGISGDTEEMAYTL